MKTKILIIGVFLVFALLSCHQSVFNDAGITDAEEAVNSGNITVRVPMISSYLADALGISYTQPQPSESRAIMIITGVDFSLYLDSGDTLVDSWTYNAPVGGDGPDGGWGETLTTQSVPAATGYTLKADVYNTKVQGTPLLSNTSASFDIVSGGTESVIIAPIPISPTQVPTVDTPVTLPGGLDSCYDTGTTQSVIVDYGDDGVEGGTGADADTVMDQPIYSWEQEHWFEIDSTGLPIMRISATPDVLSAVFMMIYDSQGQMVTMATSGGGEPGDWIVGVDSTVALLSPDLPNSTYYVGLITIPNGTSLVSSTVDISFTAASDDEDEENDELATAASIVKGTPLSGIDLDPVDWDFPTTGGDWYKFTLDIDPLVDDPSNVDVRLVFDHDQGDLFLHLYNSSEILVPGGESDSSEGDATAATEQENLVDLDLTSGDTYYILVGSHDFPVGNTYNLQWVAGEGTINIGLE